MKRVLVTMAAMLGACAVTAAPLPATPEALAAAMQGKRVVLLGEVHDNAVQHALRAAALRKLVESGARPALAFEQFDVGAQDAIDRARRERPRDADYLVAQAKGAPGWDWALYKPFVALALEYDLPIVAANLARADAMKVAMSPGTIDAPADLLRAQEVAVVKGHCDLLPKESVPGMVGAQVARDRTLAGAIAPYAGRGVVLLTGNGHARKDMGVPRWLAVPSTSIGLLEESEDPSSAQWFDDYVVTQAANRPDPCEALRKRFKG